MAIEVNGVRNHWAFNLPWVAKGQPVVWLLMLEAIDDTLRGEHRHRVMIEGYRHRVKIEGYKRLLLVN